MLRCNCVNFRAFLLSVCGRGVGDSLVRKWTLENHLFESVSFIFLGNIQTSG